MTQIKNFNFGNGVKATIFCQSRRIRNGFAHDCAIPALKVRATCHYLNRTWERFNFESVIHAALDKFVKATYPGKVNEKVRAREYAKLVKRLNAAYDKGKFRDVCEFDNVLACAA